MRIRIAFKWVALEPRFLWCFSKLPVVVVMEVVFLRCGRVIVLREGHGDTKGEQARLH